MGYETNVYYQGNKIATLENEGDIKTLLCRANMMADDVEVKVESQPYAGLKLTAIDAGSSVTLDFIGSPPWTGSYSTDDGATWNTYNDGTYIPLTNSGDSVCFKGDITGNFVKGSKYIRFRMTGKLSASGNIMSMHTSTGFENLTTISYEYAFASLFSNCSVLKSAPQLPATTLSNGCYYGMFSSSGITTAPELPALVIPKFGYWNMFSGSSLTTAPSILPATSIGIQSYSGMFYQCYGLTTAPPISLTAFANYGAEKMFQDCTSLRIPPVLNITSATTGACQKMFQGCTQLRVNNTGASGTLFLTTPSSVSTAALDDMFTGTGGSFTGGASVSSTYYYY